MRRSTAIFFISNIATASACVNLDKPPNLAKCAVDNSCRNSDADAATGPGQDAAPSKTDKQDSGARESGKDATPNPVLHDGGLGDGSVTLPDGSTAAEARPCQVAGQLAAAGTVCRAAAGACDVPEICDGVSGVCPADELAAAGTVCRAAAGDCDIAEACTGSSPACPADSFKAAGTVCRAV
ncbi:MAG TPA: hypothetical protein VMK12_24620, partial [Anaeromyxobacteraceae bacterium]|nr:hypothetical protein [Anaeromyxobacteraceae bacterium]